MSRTGGLFRSPVAAIALLIGSVALGLAIWTMTMPQHVPLASSVGGEFALVDQNGKAVTRADFAGKPMIVFFGYTHCPDVCPTTLSDLTQMLNAYGTSEPVSALFITVDPERDTPAVMKDYLSSFDPRISGLTGTPEAIKAVEKAYKVYAKKVPTKDGDYSMDHTAVVYVMDRDGRFVNALNLSQKPEAAAEEFRREL
ncbi:SCO family protein [Lichenihabitans sp. PAMC28606]|uniref:SCO family protein n=1 Tax=Lichenihabitans sp. PAMC28606 TaxID=2880932 RepID=UPI001D0A7B72|nr:SCO family protein [Lichenihabitans sp. PAMC28606]UDL94475.1 SCO family protein [Lichenihabitans sp. PAMC28606]